MLSTRSRKIFIVSAMLRRRRMKMKAALVYWYTYCVKDEKYEPGTTFLSNKIGRILRHKGYCVERIRMKPRTFMLLSEIINECCDIHTDGRSKLTTDQRLFISLTFISRDYTNGDLRDNFQISAETISRCLNDMLNHITSLYDKFVKQPDVNNEILMNRNRIAMLSITSYAKNFTNCLVALDGS